MESLLAVSVLINVLLWTTNEARSPQGNFAASNGSRHLPEKVPTSLTVTPLLPGSNRSLACRPGHLCMLIQSVENRRITAAEVANKYRRKKREASRLEPSNDDAIQSTSTEFLSTESTLSDVSTSSLEPSTTDSAITSTASELLSTESTPSDVSTSSLEPSTTDSTITSTASELLSTEGTPSDVSTSSVEPSTTDSAITSTASELLSTESTPSDMSTSNVEPSTTDFAITSTASEFLSTESTYSDVSTSSLETSTEKDIQSPSVEIMSTDVSTTIPKYSTEPGNGTIPAEIMSTGSTPSDVSTTVPESSIEYGNDTTSAKFMSTESIISEVSTGITELSTGFAADMSSRAMSTNAPDLTTDVFIITSSHDMMPTESSSSDMSTDTMSSSTNTSGIMMSTSAIEIITNTADLLSEESTTSLAQPVTSVDGLSTESITSDTSAYSTAVMTTLPTYSMTSDSTEDVTVTKQTVTTVSLQPTTSHDVCGCLNGGTCHEESNTCFCPEWFIGKQCESYVTSTLNLTEEVNDTYIENENLTMSCLFLVYVTPDNGSIPEYSIDVIWKLNNIRLSNSSRVDIYTNSNKDATNSTLIMNSLGSRDSGSLSCNFILKNGAPLYQEVGTSKTHQNFSVTQLPVMSLEPRCSYIRIQQNTTFTCSEQSGSTPQYIDWFINGTKNCTENGTVSRYPFIADMPQSTTVGCRGCLENLDRCGEIINSTVTVIKPEQS